MNCANCGNELELGSYNGAPAFLPCDCVSDEKCDDGDKCSDCESLVAQYDEGHDEGYKAGYDEGHDEGYKAGYDEGVESVDLDAEYDKGYEAGVTEARNNPRLVV